MVSKNSLRFVYESRTKMATRNKHKHGQFGSPRKRDKAFSKGLIALGLDRPLECAALLYTFALVILCIHSLDELYIIRMHCPHCYEPVNDECACEECAKDT